MVWNKTSVGAVQSYNMPYESSYGGVHLLEHVIKEFPTSVKSMPQPSDVMKRRAFTCSNVMRSQNNPAKPTLSRVVPFGKVFPFLEREGGDVAVLFLEFQRDKPEQPSQLVQQDVWWQASHQPRGETPCRHCWLAKDACLYWSSKVTAEKTKRAYPIKHLYLSCKPALRCGLDRKCCYGLRRVGGGHWWRQRRSGQQNDEMNALPRSDASNEWE